MKIILGASKPKHWKIGAALIMWWENTPASHSYSVITISPSFTLVFQSVGSGTEFSSLQYFLEHNTPVYEKVIEITDAQFENLISKLVSSLKTKYSLLHLLGLFIKRLIQYTTGKIISAPFKDHGKSAVCVQSLCLVVDASEIVRDAEDPEDMGMFEALQMLHKIPGNELLNG